MATLAELRVEARSLANQENSNFVSDSELNTFLNRAYQSCYHLIVSKRADYYVSDTPATVTVAEGDSEISVPADFYRLVGLDREEATDEWREVEAFNFRERNHKARIYYRNSRVRFHLMGKVISLRPKQNAAGTYNIWYVPQPQTLANDTDVPDLIEGWDDYVAIRAAIRCLIKEESNTGPLQSELTRIEQKIMANLWDRDSTGTEVIADVEGHAMDHHEWYGGWE